MFRKMLIAVILGGYIIQAAQAQEPDGSEQAAQADKRTFQSPAQESIAVEIVRGYYVGLLFGSTTALVESILAAVMVQNWERTAIENGAMFGMPIGTIYGSARGIVGWEDTDGMLLFAARISAATPVLVGGLLGNFIVENRTKGVRNGIFIGQFLAPFGAMFGYRLYKAAFPEQATAAAKDAPVAPLPHRVMPSNVGLTDESLQGDFIFQLMEMKF